MDRRFGFRDFVISVLLSGILVSIWLAMKQYDRQWLLLQQMTKNLTQQGQELNRLDDLRYQIEKIDTRLGSGLEGPGSADIRGELAAIQNRLDQQARALESVGELKAVLEQIGERLASGTEGAGGSGGAGDLAGIQSSLQQAREKLDRTTKALEDTPAAGTEPSNTSGTGSSHSTTKRPGTDPVVVGAEQDPFYRIRAARDKPGYARGDWLVESFGVAVGKLTPLVSQDVYARIVEEKVLESLATRDPETLEWKPQLAKRWRISEDGLTVTFDLRENVRFSDGEPMTADDVVFTYNLIMDPKIATPQLRSYFAKIESVEKIGDHRVVFRLNEPYFKGFEICAGLSVLAEHFYSQFTPEEINEKPGLLFGSGPYKLSIDPVDWAPGSGKIELVRNDRYWGLNPGFDKIVYREIEEDTARLASFFNGEVDRYTPTPEQYPQLKSNPTIREKSNMYEYETIVGGYRYIGWNQKRNGKPTLFADHRVRRAMTMLINREEMCQRLMAGLGSVSTGPFHRLGKQASPAVEAWPYDPPGAIALLKEIGFEDRDGDGVIESADGTPFRFKFTYRTGSENYHLMALYLKDAYARAGIAMELDRLEWTIMLQRLDERDFDAITLGWTGTIESDPYQIFHSDQITGKGHNFIHYESKELDGLIEKARMTVDEPQRMTLWHRCHEILHRDQPYTFLFTVKAATFVNRRIRNVLVTPVGLNDNTEWFVPVTDRKWAK